MLNKILLALGVVVIVSALGKPHAVKTDDEAFTTVLTYPSHFFRERSDM